jgi:hypothetical protein
MTIALPRKSGKDGASFLIVPAGKKIEWISPRRVVRLQFSGRLQNQGLE